MIRKQLRSTPARLARGNAMYESNAAKARRREEPTPTKKKRAGLANAKKDRKAATLAKHATAIQFREKQPSQNRPKGLKPQNPPKGFKSATTACHSSGSSTSTTARLPQSGIPRWPLWLATIPLPSESVCTQPAPVHRRHPAPINKALPNPSHRHPHVLRLKRAAVDDDDFLHEIRCAVDEWARGDESDEE
ncbi:hypothetical protein FRC00_001848 [Tulasnella sp. 408]|nr:hypothetical protein FRC00_001848 [Tulasnella sp. 408]